MSTHPAESVSVPFRGVVAVDGPSGSGKSTVSRRLASALGARYLDTGAMYRGVTWAVLHAGADPHDTDAVRAIATSAVVDITTDPIAPTISVNGEPVDIEIRGERVTGAVSAVSAVPEVRAALVAQQRRIIGDGGIVVEGRDIGTVVVPSAQLKVYLTASSQARAQRRSAERGATDVTATHADLARRDTLDSSRVTSPLTKADDAVELDTTHLGIDDVVDTLLGLLHATVRPQ